MEETLVSEKAYRIDFDMEWIAEHKSDYETYPAEFLASQLNNRKMYRAHAEGSFSVIVQLQVEENNSESAEKAIVDTVVDILGASVVNKLTLGPAEPSASESVPEYDDEQSLIDKIEEWRTKLYEEIEAVEKTEAEAEEPEKRVGGRRGKKSENLGEVAEFTDGLREKLLADVKGQNHAVDAFVAAIFKMKTHGNAGKGPRAVCLFAGAPGVGKTFLAERAAHYLRLPYRRFDMSGYAEDDTGLTTFRGINPSFKAASAGEVTGFVEENPRCVLLFDEIEKAHPAVINLFLQILDAGTCKDFYRDENVDFSQAIIIMTSNVGRNLYNSGDRKNFSLLTQSVLIDALGKDMTDKGQPFFPAPILSRMSRGTVVMFNRLDTVALNEITVMETERVASQFGRVFGKKIHGKKNIPALVLFAAGGNPDARSIKGRVSTVMEDEVQSMCAQLPKETRAEAIDKIENINFTLDLDGATEEAKRLFVTEEKPAILLFSNDGAQLAARARRKDFSLAVTDNLDKAKELLRGETGIAVVDVKCNLREMGYVPSDVEDLDSDGNALIEYIREFYEEVPVYILDREWGDKAEEVCRSYLRKGARGVVRYDDGKPAAFLKELERCCHDTHLTAVADYLGKNNRVLAYNTAQIFSDDGKTAEIRFADMELKRNLYAGDSEHILGDAMRPTVRFSDVIGVAEAKEALKEFGDFFANPRKYAATGVKMPRGVLLYGPPGTGKTLLAKAMAGESDVTFIQKNATEFMKKYYGEGVDAVREMFRLARKYAPSVLFIDEVDAVGRERTGDASAIATDQLLTAFLSEMDGFVYDEKRPVLVIAATNFHIERQSPGDNKVLDPAFVRRFDRRIEVGLPGKDERKQFILYYLAKHGVTGISDDAVNNVAVRTYGSSPADIETIIQYVLRKKRKDAITDNDLLVAVDAVEHGAEKQWSEEDIRKTAVHEAGHVLMGWLAGRIPEYATTISRGGYGGYVMSESDEGRMSPDKREVLDRICMTLGGRAAEMEFYGEDGITAGVSSDLRHATDLATRMVCEWGMEGDLIASFGNTVGGEAGQKRFAAIEGILAKQATRAAKFAAENRETLGLIADELVKRNSMTRKDLTELLADRTRNL